MSQSLEITGTDALIVIDVQNDFCPGGALAVPEGDRIIATINALMPRFHHVAFSQDWHPVGHSSFASAHPGKQVFETTEMPYGPQILWPDHCVIGSEGAAFHPALDQSRANVVVRKGSNPQIDSYSSFFENDRITPTGLSGYLKQRGVERLFLTGLAFEYCVGFSALDGAAQGFEACIIEDAVGGFGNDNTAAMTQKLRDQGVGMIRAADLSDV